MDDRRLKKIFQFNEADLFANRSGRLSENQKKRLMAEARAEEMSARGSTGILFVIAAGGLTFGLIIGLNAPTLATRLLFLFVLGVVWPLAWGWRAWKILREARRLLKAKQVRAARGRVRLVGQEEASGGVDYVLRVGDIQFDVEENPAGAIVDGDEYAVYYLEETEEILSLELLVPK